MKAGWLILFFAAVATIGCIPGDLLSLDSPGNIVIGASVGQAGTDGNSKLLNGSLARADDYTLFEVSGVPAGRSVRIETTSLSAPGSLFTIALFDENMNLLRRGSIAFNVAMRHTLYADSETLFVGVAGANTFARGSFQLRVVEEDDFGAPAPATQRVLLNFAATRSVRVQSRTPFDMPAFHGSILGAAFAPSTEMIKQMIVDRIRADYLGYNVEIFTSDDPELPAEPYSTIHFGGYDSALLGLADNVDQYNERPAQNAIIYVETFATFEYLEMTPEEIASMLANVASHELGHLLGLYHTRNPADVMDTTATAWELTENQGFVRAELEPSVFPVGFEDSPALLAQIVGTRPVTDADLKDRGTAKKIVVRSSIANAVRAQFGHGCGTCTECR